jgi:hypothetical protein
MISGIVRLSLLTVLIPLAPLVRITCGAAMLLGALAAAIFEISAASPKFPLVETLMLSVGFGIFAVAYHSVLAFLQR